MQLGQSASPISELLAAAAVSEKQGQLNQSRRLLIEAASLDETSRSRFEWAAFLARRGDFAGASTEWIRIWEAIEMTDDTALAVTVASNLAALHRRNGDLPTASQWHSRMLRTAVRLMRSRNGNVPREIWLDCVQESIVIGSFPAARQLLKVVLKASRARRDLLAEGDAWGLWSVVCLRCGRQAEAIRALTRAIQRHRMVGADAELAADALNLASLMIVRGRPRAAKSAAALAFRHAIRSQEFDLIRRAEQLCYTLRRAIRQLELKATQN